MPFTDGEGAEPSGPTFRSASVFRVRRVTPADAEGVAALFVECVGGELEQHRTGFERELASAQKNNLVLIAEAENEIIGFARARFVQPPLHSENVAPAGWYLLGVNVAPAFRRRGVGEALTQARLRWIAECAGEAFYFTDEENHPSIALHERFGFEPVGRDVVHPDALPSAGVRMVYRLDLSGRVAR